MPSATRDNSAPRTIRRRNRNGTHPEFNAPNRQVGFAPGYVLDDESEFELDVSGFGLQVSHFERIPDGISSSRDEPGEHAYLLRYHYRDRDHQPCHRTVFFLGGRPRIHFLHEDPRYPHSPIVDYKLIKRWSGQLLLHVSYPDITRDPIRTPFGTGRDISRPDYLVDIARLQLLPTHSCSSSSSGYTVLAFNSESECEN